MIWYLLVCKIFCDHGICKQVQDHLLWFLITGRDPFWMNLNRQIIASRSGAIDHCEWHWTNDQTHISQEQTLILLRWLCNRHRRKSNKFCRMKVLVEVVKGKLDFYTDNLHNGLAFWWDDLSSIFTLTSGLCRTLHINHMQDKGW